MGEARKDTRRPPAAFRLTNEARQLLKAMADASGVSMTAMLEITIREAAERKGLR